MRIAILGWGSLIWNPGDLPREGAWQKPGPALHLEFSRISRDCRLTLVIDRDHSDSCETYFTLSPRVDLDDTVRDLQDREGTTKSRIGFVDLEKDTRNGRDTHAVGTIASWAEANGFLGVVWTDLDQNFEREAGLAFTVPNAIAYLEGLSKTAKERAREYIENAPAEASTPLRRAFHPDS